MQINSVFNKIKKFFLLSFFTMLEFSLFKFASADLKNPLQSETFADLIAKITQIVAKVGLPIAVIAIIYAGFLFVTARGNEEQIKTAKKAFFWAIIGTALLLGAWAIATAIKEFLVTL
jgi:hypothetical protein